MKIKAIVAIFIPWEFNQKYVHLGVSYPGVPNGWQKIVKKAIKDLEPIIWHRGKYLPRFVKRFIHYMANENHIYHVHSKFWHDIRNHYTSGMMITDIKDKFAGLRIYGYFNTACDAIVDRASDECHETCEKCGGHNDVKINHHGWMYCYCAKCRYEENIIIDVEEDENIDVSNIETQTIKIDKIL